MPAFKIPNQPPTINKTVRFPIDVIEAVEGCLKGNNSTFSSFVIAALRYALENLKENHAPYGDGKKS